MSFGYSVGDFVLLTTLAYKTVQNARSSCGAHDSLTREVGSLHIVLKRLETEVSKPNSILNRKGDHRRRELATLARDCKNVLNVLSRILEKYNELSEEKKSLKKLWQKVRFGNGEMQDLGKIRLEVVTYTQALTLFLNLLSVGTLGKMEAYMECHGDDLREIKQSLHWVTASMQATSNREGSILTTYTEDDKAVWKDFRRELIKEGFSSRLLDKHQRAIKRYIMELGRRGVLDELQDEPPTNDEAAPVSEVVVSYLADIAVFEEEAPNLNSPAHSTSLVYVDASEGASSDTTTETVSGSAGPIDKRSDELPSSKSSTFIDDAKVVPCNLPDLGQLAESGSSDVDIDEERDDAYTPGCTPRPAGVSSPKYAGGNNPALHSQQKLARETLVPVEEVLDYITNEEPEEEDDTSDGYGSSSSSSSVAPQIPTIAESQAQRLSNVVTHQTGQTKPISYWDNYENRPNSTMSTQRRKPTASITYVQSPATSSQHLLSIAQATIKSVDSIVFSRHATVEDVVDEDFLPHAHPNCITGAKSSSIFSLIRSDLGDHSNFISSQSHLKETFKAQHASRVRKSEDQPPLLADIDCTDLERPRPITIPACETPTNISPLDHSARRNQAKQIDRISNPTVPNMKKPFGKKETNEAIATPSRPGISHHADYPNDELHDEEREQMFNEVFDNRDEHLSAAEKEASCEMWVRSCMLNDRRFRRKSVNGFILSDVERGGSPGAEWGSASEREASRERRKEREKWYERLRPKGNMYKPLSAHPSRTYASPFNTRWSSESEPESEPVSSPYGEPSRKKTVGKSALSTRLAEWGSASDRDDIDTQTHRGRATKKTPK